MSDEIFYEHSDEYNKLIGITQRLVDHDKPYIRLLLDEIRVYQPFLGSCMLGYTVDFKGAEADAVFMLHLLLWAAYRDKPACRKTAITESRYNKTMNRNIFFFKYLEKEEGAPAFNDAVTEDLQKNNHGIQIAFINLCIKQWPSLANLNNEKRNEVIIGIKSFVECFEELGS